MSKKDRISKEIDQLREKRQNWFSAMLGLASAIALVVYSVIIGEKPLYVLLVGVFGFIAFSITAFSYRRIDGAIDDLLDDLEKEE
jgi:hypothetical protein